MSRVFLHILLLLILIPGCKKNTYIIPQDELVEILSDIHYAEGITNTNVRQFMTSQDRSKAIERVIEAKGIERARFDSTMHYYALHTRKYEVLYDKVIQELMIRETRVKAGQFDRSYLYKTMNLMKDYPEDSVLRDSVLKEFWWGDRKVVVDEVTSWKGDYDKVYLDSVPHKGFVLKADIRLFPNDSSLNPRTVFQVEYLTDSVTGDSILSDTCFLFRDSLVSCNLYLHTSDSLPLHKLNIMFLDQDSTLVRKNAILNNIRLYELADPDDPALQLPEKFIKQ
ncbi:DUF4296 domain-containing protein [Saccharicrinis sp. FJH62]|uniref:DUF4296 domain-containing protein n=1 Tax=Saccharicrinis sp. FJH62 TaxID=3344657 RepID=UPI0035D3F539